MAYVPDLDWVNDAPPGFTAERMRKMQLGIAGADADAQAGIAAAAEAMAMAVSTASPTVNVKAFGAMGDGLADDSGAINEAIASGARTVLIPAGQYRIEADPIRLMQDTTLQMEAATTLLNDRIDSEYMIVNGVVGDTEFAYGYEGPGNIRIFGNGATLDCGPRASRGSGTEALAITHAQDVTIDGLNFRNNYMSHAMEFNAVRNGVVRNCTFTAMDPGASSNREFINIDHSYQGGFPGWGAWDDTPCENITVENCVFTAGQVAVGTHAGAIPSPHRGVRIINCLIEGMSQHGIRAKSWSGSLISGCRIQSTQRQGVLVEGSDGLVITGSVLDSTALESASYYPIEITSTSSKVKVYGNRVIKGVADNVAAVSVTSSTEWCEVATHGLDRGSARFVHNASQTCYLDGVCVLRIADDTAVALPMPGYDQQGMAIITGHGTGAYMPRGLYWVRASGASFLNVIPVSALAAANVTLTTGVLSGTTGTDGNVTLSAGINAEGVGCLYIENRSAAERRIDVQFVAG